VRGEKSPANAVEEPAGDFSLRRITLNLQNRAGSLEMTIIIE
jgi:hypothetical protein